MIVCGTLESINSNEKLLKNIVDILEPHRNGSCQLTIKCITKDHSVPLILDKKWQIDPSASLINNLKNLLGKENIKVKYQ